MIRLLVSLLIFTLSYSAKAELSYELLDKLTESPASLTGNFRQEKKLAEFDVAITSEGHFEYKRDQYIRWVTEKPVINELVMTPDDIVSRQGSDETLRIDTNKNPTVKVMSKIFFAVMTAEWYELSEYFFANGQQLDDSWTVTLTPRNEIIKSTISYVELAGNTLLREVTMLEANGDRTHIIFSNMRK